MGNIKTSVVTKMRDYEVMLNNEFSVKLLDCWYSPEKARNIISFRSLYNDGFQFQFDNDNDSILVYKHKYLYFKASPYNGVYESVICIGRNNNILTLNVGSSNDDLDKSSF